MLYSLSMWRWVSVMCWSCGRANKLVWPRENVCQSILRPAVYIYKTELRPAVYIYKSVSITCRWFIWSTTLVLKKKWSRKKTVGVGKKTKNYIPYWGMQSNSGLMQSSSSTCIIYCTLCYIVTEANKYCDRGKYRDCGKLYL